MREPATFDQLSTVIRERRTSMFVGPGPNGG